MLPGAAVGVDPRPVVRPSGWWYLVAVALAVGGIIAGLMAVTLTQLGLWILTIGVGLAIAYGISDEIHQSFVPGRDASVGDLIADSVGAALGAGLVVYLLRRSRRPTIE